MNTSDGSVKICLYPSSSLGVLTSLEFSELQFIAATAAPGPPKKKERKRRGRARRRRGVGEERGGAGQALLLVSAAWQSWAEMLAGAATSGLL